MEDRKMSRNLRNIVVWLGVIVFVGNSSLVRAQEEGRVEVVQKVFHVEHVNVARIQKLLSVFEVMVEADMELKVIAVKGMPDGVAAVEAAIKRLDVPPPPAKNVELTVYMLNATVNPVTGATIPSELGEVVHQLESVFAYKGFRLWETIILRAREGEVGGQKNLHGVIPETGASYDFTFNSAVIVPDEKGNVIRINNLTMGMGGARVADTDSAVEEPPSRSAVIKTDIDVREGQKVVVGKANVGVKEKSALILVVTAKVLD
jgi:hypothetical protein